MLWQRALECPTAPSRAEDSGAGAQDGLILALSTALADLLVQRGGDELSAAALRILFDPRFAAWFDATAADASRPLRVGAAAVRLSTVFHWAPSASLGARDCQPLPRLVHARSYQLGHASPLRMTPRAPDFGARALLVAPL